MVSNFSKKHIVMSLSLITSTRFFVQRTWKVTHGQIRDYGGCSYTVFAFRQTSLYQSSTKEGMLSQCKIHLFVEIFVFSLWMCCCKCCRTSRWTAWFTFALGEQILMDKSVDNKKADQHGFCLWYARLWLSWPHKLRICLWRIWCFVSGHTGWLKSHHNQYLPSRIPTILMKG